MLTQKLMTDIEQINNIINDYKKSFTGKIFFCSCSKLCKYNDQLIIVDDIANVIKLFEELEGSESTIFGYFMIKRKTERKYMSNHVQYKFEKQFIWN